MCPGEDIPGPGYKCAKAGGMAEAAAWARGGTGQGLNVGEAGERR